MSKIFVQIASYRDPQLVYTLDSLLQNAANPDKLHICIAFQYSEEDSFTKDLDKYRDDSRFTIIDIPYKESKGACYARNLIQQEYNDETYTLQLDSHHRFTQHWDKLCIEMLQELQYIGYKKPLLTSYIPSYDPKNDPDARVDTPWGMSFDRFTPEGVVFFLPYYIDKDASYPIRARFFSAHFAFTIGQHAVEVQHDPQYYFHGEEISLAVRSFTHGYDLFHPHKVIAWHEYTREGRTKQWDDDNTWGERNQYCHSKLRSLLNIDNQKDIVEFRYGLGVERTLKDYQTYAGIKFTDRSITQACKDNIEPPGKEKEHYLTVFKHALDLNNDDFKFDDYTFAAITLHSSTGKELYRKDITDFNSKVQSGKPFTLWVEANIQKPHSWSVWAYSEKNGWSEKIEKEL